MTTSGRKYESFVNSRVDIYGTTVLMEAITKTPDDTTWLLLLVRSQIEINLQDDRKRTALMLACKHSAAITKELIKTDFTDKIDKKLMDYRGRTARMYAEKYNPELVDMIDAIPDSFEPSVSHNGDGGESGV